MKYRLTLGPNIQSTLNTLSSNLGLTKSEIMRRSLKLYFEAIKYDYVNLYNGDLITKVTIK